MASTINLTVTADHPVPISVASGGQGLVKNVAGDTLYYADNPQVSAGTNQGSLTAAQSKTFTGPTWVISATSTTVTATMSDASELALLRTMPATIFIDPVGILGEPAAVTGTWAAAHSTSSAQVENAFNSSNAQNDSISFDVTLAAGLWDFSINHVMQATSAIATVALDGTTVGTIDFYNASVLINQTHTIANISVPTTGVHRFSITAATRNASSTGWTLQVGRIQLREAVYNAGNLGAVGLSGPSYKFIGSPIQNTGSGFQTITASPHTPVGIDSITTTGTATGTITLNYASLGAIGIVTFWVVPDETFVINDIDGGASVGLQTAIINTTKNGAQVDPTTLTTSTYPNSNFWVGGIFKVS